MLSRIKMIKTSLDLAMTQVQIHTDAVGRFNSATDSKKPGNF